MASPEERFAAAGAHFPEPVQALLQQIPARQGLLPGPMVEEIMGRMKCSDIDRLMIMLLPLAAAYARAPISKFQVGAVAAGLTNASKTPALYLGANIEFTHQALSFSIHAEQAGMANAWLNGERGISRLAVSAAPCGYCRQFLFEVVNGQAMQILVAVQGTAPPRSNPLTYFLPDAFGPNDLGVNGGLMQPQSNGVTLSNPDPLAQAAAAAANACYAPYTKNFSGVALQTADGAIFAGRYAENAAHNPSMSPLQSAIALMNMSGALSPAAAIVRAVLVEVPTLASQHDATVAVLSSLAPGVTLEYFPVS